MRFALICLGTHGDVRPFIALGAGLTKKGHEVRIATHPRERELCQSCGLDFFPLEIDLSVLHEPAPSKIHLARQVTKAMLTSLDQQFERLPALLSGVDMAIYGLLAIAVPHVAECAGVSAVRLLLQPEVRTRTYPSSFFWPKSSYGPVGNYLSHLAAEQFGWQPFRKRVDGWRTSKGMSSIGIQGLAAYRPFGKAVTLVAISPTFLARPRDWKRGIEMVGFFQLPTSQWTPPQSLANFLERDNPPIYIGFGSLARSWSKEALSGLISVVERLNLRAILSGDLKVDPATLPTSVLLHREAPHDWLFPRVAAVVHHGGAGTTAAGLYAGRPTLIIPEIFDQFMWGSQVHRLGLGPIPCPSKRLTEALFEQAVNSLIENLSYRKNADQISLALKKEDPVENVLNAINCSATH